VSHRLVRASSPSTCRRRGGVACGTSVTEKKTVTEMPNLVDFFAEMACVRLVLRHRVVACEGVLMRKVGCYGETAAC
jgi:hypothetical protein